jgi:hypothetical protein
MKPAFSSVGQAAAFCLFLLALLLLPVIFTRGMLPPREEIYSSVPWRMGLYPYIHDVIFQQKGDVDIAFMGGSTMYMGVNTPYVEAALAKSLGRKVCVFTASWNWRGFDALYFVAKDLLENRHVNTIVFSDVTEWDDAPHPMAPYLFRFGDDAAELRGMPLRHVPQYYFAAILGMPRNLLSLIRPNDPRTFFDPTDDGPTAGVPHAPFAITDPAASLGSEEEEIGYHFAKFVDYSPASPASPSDACVYSQGTANKFQFSKSRLPALQLYFLNKFLTLVRAHRTRLVMLTIPSPGEPLTPFIPEAADWPAILGPDVTIVGIPPAKFYAGMTPPDIDKITPDRGHLNKNGQQYFTKVITPSLLKIYESPSGH